MTTKSWKQAMKKIHPQNINNSDIVGDLHIYHELSQKRNLTFTISNLFVSAFISHDIVEKSPLTFLQFSWMCGQTIEFNDLPSCKPLKQLDESSPYFWDSWGVDPCCQPHNPAIAVQLCQMHQDYHKSGLYYKPNNYWLMCLIDFPRRKSPSSYSSPSWPDFVPAAKTTIITYGASASFGTVVSTSHLKGVSPSSLTGTRCLTTWKVTQGKLWWIHLYSPHYLA